MQPGYAGEAGGKDSMWTCGSYILPRVSVGCERSCHRITGAGRHSGARSVTVNVVLEASPNWRVDLCFYEEAPARPWDLL